MTNLNAEGNSIKGGEKSNEFDMRKFLTITLQLLGIVYITYSFQLEQSLSLFKLTLFAGIGFVLQLFIPQRYKVYYFSLLGMIAAIFFTGILNGVLIIAYGLIMVSCASLIAQRGLRYVVVGLLFAILIALFAIKPVWVREHFIVFSVLGSMFMFRLSLFLYEKHHNPGNGRFVEDIAYFFMIPNIAITLFPVVDYRTFIEKNKASEMWNTYKKGVQWMVLGVFHLLVYRFIYYYLYVPNGEVKDLFSFGHYAVTNYLLIIRLSGIFHFGVGVLCLFGFNLPSVFNNYFLASGFSDLWRRINIYYRDYVIKVFYYPLFFRFRKFGMIKAQIISIMMIFLLTWLLHSFQWFWLKGKFPLRLVDVLYWGTFGVLVAINTVLEMKKNRMKTAHSKWWISIKVSAQILFMFLFMSFLWSLWSAKSLEEWISTVAPVFTSEIHQYLIGFGVLVAAWLTAVFLHRLIVGFQWGNWINPAPESKMATFWSVSMLCGILLFKVEPVKNTIENTMNVDLIGFLTPKLKQSDAQLLIEGYYEEILIGNDLTSPISDELGKIKLKFEDTEAAKYVPDIRNFIIKPNISYIFKEKQFTTNKWGMRDKKYTQKPAPNTIRMGFTSGSFVVGSGVADNEVFNRIMDSSMNSKSESIKYEYLNFGVSSYDILQCLYNFEKGKQYRFEMDYFAFVSHGVDFHKNIKSLLNCYNRGYEIPYPFLEDIIAKSGINRTMPEREQFKRLEKYSEELIEKAYEHFVLLCREHSMTPIWVYWPTVNSFIDQSFILTQIAEKTGFIIVDLDNVFDGYDPDDLIVNDHDRHPNALAHKLVAEELVRIFTEEITLTKKPSLKKKPFRVR